MNQRDPSDRPANAAEPLPPDEAKLVVGKPETGKPDAGNSGPAGYAKASRVRRALGWALRIAVAAYLGLLLLLMFFENSLIFFPSRYPDGDWRPRNLEFEDAEFTASDGVRLHGWYVPCPAARAYVLYSHGNGGHLAHRAEFLRLWRDRLNATILAYDYRGYGRSEGSPTETGVYDDARAARAWLARRAGIREQDVVQFGESLGGAVAVNLAADGARGLVLENTFSTLADVAAYHYPFAPVRLLLRSRFDSCESIAKYHGPLLEFHGDRDPVVPLASAERLFASANEPKKLVVIAGGGHNDPPTERFVDEVSAFLDALPPMAAAK